MGHDMVFISFEKFIRNSLYKYISFDLLQNNYNSLLMGIETLYDAKQVQLNRIFN